MTDYTLAATLDMVFDQLDNLPPGPLSEADEEMVSWAYATISLMPDYPPFSRGEWGFVQYSNVLDDRETMEGLVHRIPGGKAELERVLARPRKHWEYIL